MAGKVPVQGAREPRGSREPWDPGARSGEPPVALSERQTAVLRALVAAYIGQTEPVSSRTVSHLLPVHLSPASVRNTMAELTELGLIEKPHRSAGRVPTEQGLRVFVNRLLERHDLERYERCRLADAFGDTPEPDALLRVASRLLSEGTHQLGFVLPPRPSRVVLQHVTLVRLSSSRLLAVLVGQGGVTRELVLEDEGRGDQAELDRIAATLNRIGAGLTLEELRERVVQEATALRARADRLLDRAFRTAQRIAAADGLGPSDLVIATRLALLDQPELRDPRFLRDLFAAVEACEKLVEVLDKMLAARGVQVAFGAELDDPELQRLALVAAPYGDPSRPLGLLGVIGPSRMDYARVIPLVEYVSELVTEKLTA